MTEEFMAGTAGQGAALPKTTRQTGPLFKPFEWIDVNGCKDLPAARVLRFVSDARDIGMGCAVIMQLLERESINQDGADEAGNDMPPLMSPSDSFSLLRLAKTSLQRLDGQASDLMDWAGDYHKKPKQVG